METFHSKWLGLFEGPKKRAAEILHSHTGANWSLIMPASDIDTNPIGSTKEKLESYVGWVYACASLISEDVRSNPWELYRRNGKRREDWQVVENNPALDILRRPNEQQTWGSFAELTDIHYSLGGEAFWHVITRNGEAGGTPVGLQVIFPHWIDRAVISNGRVVGWRVIPPGQVPFTIPAEDFIRIYRPHPLESLKAASPVEAFAVSHYMDLYFRAYGMSVMRNDGGVPAGLLSSDQELTQDQGSDLAERWKQKYRQKRDEIAVMGNGLKYQPIAIPVQDLKFLEIGQFTREQILSAYRVPPAVLGMTTDFNRANSEAAMVSYQRQAIQPRLNRYQEAINTFLLPRIMGAAASGFFFEFDNPVDEDEVAKRERATVMLEHGALSINQYREAMGEDPLPDGDVFLIPTRTHTLVKTLTPVEPIEPEEPTPEDDEDRGLVERLELVAVRRENRQLKIEAAERKHYNALRGYFAREYQQNKRSGMTLATLDANDLQELGVDPTDERLRLRDGDDLVQHYERLKSEVAKQLARELAEREVTT